VRVFRSRKTPVLNLGVVNVERHLRASPRTSAPSTAEINPPRVRGIKYLEKARPDAVPPGMLVSTIEQVQALVRRERS